MYPTIFVQQITDKPEFEVPICKVLQPLDGRYLEAGTRPVALGLCAAATEHARLHWTCCLGARNMARWPFSCVRFEANRLIQDPYFYPLVRSDEQARLPVGMHIGNANPANLEDTRQRIGLRCRFLGHVRKHGWGLPRGDYQQAARVISRAALRLHRVFGPMDPVGVQRHQATRGRYESCRKTSSRPTVCTCPATAAPTISNTSLSIPRENTLMTGTDFGHVDMSVEIDALRTLAKRRKVRPELARKDLGR